MNSEYGRQPGCVVARYSEAVGPSIKIKKELWARIEQAAAAAGYSSPQEFVEHSLEREVAKLEAEQPDEEVLRRLKGLGYID